MNIYIGNLALDTTEEELMQEFLVFGKVLSIRLMNDIDIGSGQNHGYGFVEMALKSEGETAITSLKGSLLRGRVIDVVSALPLSDSKPTGLINRRRGRKPLSRFAGDKVY